jgi:hypothetical protein
MPALEREATYIRKQCAEERCWRSRNIPPFAGTLSHRQNFRHHIQGMNYATSFYHDND